MKGRQLARVSPFSEGHDAIAATPGKGMKACGAGLQGSTAGLESQAGLCLAKAVGNQLLVRDCLLVCTHF